MAYDDGLPGGNRNPNGGKVAGVLNDGFRTTVTLLIGSTVDSTGVVHGTDGAVIDLTAEGAIVDPSVDATQRLEGYIEEKGVTPPSISIGEKIDTTTMRNRKNRTYAPTTLKEYGDMSVTAAYKTSIYSGDFNSLVGRLGVMVTTFPDNSRYATMGWVQSVTPGAISQGAQPEVDITFSIGSADECGNELDAISAYVPGETCTASSGSGSTAGFMPPKMAPEDLVPPKVVIPEKKK